MTDTKLTVQFLIPGSKSYSEEECRKAEKPNAGYDKHHFTITYKPNKRNRHQGGNENPIRETIYFETRKAAPAVQVVQMAADAYNAMIENPPEGYRQFGWKSLSKRSKIEAHLDVLKYDLQAYSYTYFIAPD